MKRTTKSADLHCTICHTPIPADSDWYTMTDEWPPGVLLRVCGECGVGSRGHVLSLLEGAA